MKRKKLKETMKLRGLYIPLIKERGFRFQGTINYGEMTSTYLETINGRNELF